MAKSKNKAKATETHKAANQHNGKEKLRHTHMDTGGNQGDWKHEGQLKLRTMKEEVKLKARHMKHEAHKIKQEAT